MINWLLAVLHILLQRFQGDTSRLVHLHRPSFTTSLCIPRLSWRCSSHLFCDSCSCFPRYHSVFQTQLHTLTCKFLSPKVFPSLKSKDNWHFATSLLCPQNACSEKDRASPVISSATCERKITCQDLGLDWAAIGAMSCGGPGRSVKLIWIETGEGGSECLQCT